MSKFTEIVKEDTPRIIIKFEFDEQGRDQYEWGNIGNIPLMSLIGGIVNVQVELSDISLDRLVIHDKICPDQMLVITWDKDTKDFDWFVHRNVPKYGMLGMLDLIRATMVDSIRARQSTIQQPTLVDINGQPIRR